MRITQRTLALSLCPLLFAYHLEARAETLYVAGYGGDFQDIMQQKVIPGFSEETGADVVYVAGNSTDTLAKLLASRNSPQIDVSIMDDGPTYQAINYGLCQSLEGMPALDQVYDFARFPDDKAIGTSIVAGGLAYNQAYFEEQGWAPPESWTDLADPRYKGLLNIPSISNSYGVYALVMLARANGGDESDIEPGFDAMTGGISDSVLSFTPSPGQASELYQSREIVMSVWGSGRVKALADSGFPIAFAYPKEGAVALVQGTCVSEGSPRAELARAFIDWMLRPEIQVLMAQERAQGPANKNVELDAETAEEVPYGDKVDHLVTLDWNQVNQQRMEWTQRWNRQVER
ncbi:ABC transporter substrate-binding protein [Halotalea alkalilenta]|nr:ABC transporter substrate-binding protein [Halotalea alkalilenta]